MADVAGQREQFKVSLDQALTVAEVHTLGAVACRTLHRDTTTGLGFGQRQLTVRVADGEPGAQLQVAARRLGC